ncbi:hypothetical protein I6A84_13125 [Frankia sp. CNm7]|uniref:Uncharacterized protein n=1 Tax=Frankia nepalensis TaxID=1836974 RepID=A0A937RGY4_9ACTN|nr:hypothetical protein [Frankia nepalensis]MBL7497922.1 hypothetical protein [Frankia nepalensis]MBL7512709.1 hypothetical protein [Frankia nepalensis]MBL7519020.1 hypothetical protein [Frankia nepalensis]MBL7629922.1 hypothetical protein [Frankia nepalensis]
MANETDALTVLRGLWSGAGASREEVEAACGNTKVCRNMKHVNFEAANFQSGSDTGADLGAAWRAKLAREGKLRPDAGSLGDLIRSKVGKQS